MKLFIISTGTKRNRIEDDFINDGDSDEEYDSEMDDFIDDGDADQDKISLEIQKMFGYDRSK